jgi:hypothetical protein
VPLHRYPVGQRSGLQEATHKAQKATVPDSFRELSHQDIVIDPVKELLQVNVDDPVTTFLDVPLRRAHSIVCPTSRPKAVTVIGERRIESWSQYLQNGLLDDPIDDGGNS